MPSNPRYFAQRGPYTPDTRIIQCAIFLTYYEHMSRISPLPLHRGWLLLNAHNSYVRLTTSTPGPPPAHQLDINQAYGLLTFSGFLSDHARAALHRKQCSACLIKYPVLAEASARQQPCPLCAMKTNYRRLASQAGAAADRRFSGNATK